MKNVLYVLFGVIAGFILAGILVFVSRAPAGTPIVLQPAPTEAPLAVDVIGGVARPGLYKLPEGARVQDAIDAAGGLLTTADTSSLNLARLIVDGEQLGIPCTDESCTVDVTAPDLPEATEAPLENTNNENNPDLININTATLEELETLPDIGSVTAQNIIDYRDANGPFSVIEDIMNVSGIGEATFENIKDYITAY